MGNTASLDGGKPMHMHGTHDHQSSMTNPPPSYEARSRAGSADDVAPSARPAVATTSGTGPRSRSVDAAAATHASNYKQHNPASASIHVAAPSRSMEVPQATEQPHAPAQQQNVSVHEHTMMSTPVAQRWPATAQQHLRAQASDESIIFDSKATFRGAGDQIFAPRPVPATTASSNANPRANDISGSDAAAARTATAAACSASSSTAGPSASKPVHPTAASGAASSRCAAHLSPLGVQPFKDDAAGVQPLVPVELCTSPRLLLVDDFLDNATCSLLIRMAEPMMTRSRVATGLETPSRTSSSCFFVKEAAKHPVIEQLEDDIMQLFLDPGIMQGRPALERAEALQVVRYHVGEFYYEHYDNKAGDKPTRDATIIIYLCDTEEGGATHFPKAVPHPRYVEYSETDGLQHTLPRNVKADPLGQGVHIGPLKGRALLFWSCHADGREDVDSLHASLAVRKGKKYIATRWLRRIEDVPDDMSTKPELRHRLEPDH